MSAETTRTRPNAGPRPSGPYLEIYDGELVLIELARLNDELGLDGRHRIIWPGTLEADLAYQGRRVALLYAGRNEVDPLELACFDWLDELDPAERHEWLQPSELRRIEYARLLRERVRAYRLGRLELAPPE
jgi:hypothetical protein